MPRGANIAVSNAGGTFTITATGEFDLENSEKLYEAARLALMDGSCCEAICLDLSGVDFMDSTAIGALVRINNDCREASVTFGAYSPTPPVLKVLKIICLDRVLVIANPLEDREPGLGRDDEKLLGT